MWAWWFVIVPVLLVAAMLWLSFWRVARRRQRMQELAAQLHLQFRDSGLPVGMELAGTLFARASRVWNVMEGRLRGVEMVAFDCTVGMGKTPWHMTVYGVKGRQFATGEPGVMAGAWYVRSEARVWFARLDKVARVAQNLERM